VNPEGKLNLLIAQFRYQSLEINETSGKEIYQVTYEEAMSQIRKVKEINKKN